MVVNSRQVKKKKKKKKTTVLKQSTIQETNLQSKPPN